jgi:hypothetical protein
MFRAAHRSSSGALNCICSLRFIYTCGVRPLFVKPDSCVSLVQFSFSVLISAYFCGLFGVYKFNIHGSVHRSMNQ